MSILVTGAAGFIGMHACARLLARGEQVLGLDNLNDYYDPSLKLARLAELGAFPAFDFLEMDVADHVAMAALFRARGVRRCIHLAAQAGVRYSIDNPFAYERSNLAGHLSVLEACRATPAFEHLIYASSSSVYGERAIGAGGFNEDDTIEAPVSLYAATKRACELMSGVYANLYGIAQTGLRFFTVYGPWGRPDMACFKFAEAMLNNRTIELYGAGAMARDFTYIDDIIDGLMGVFDLPARRGEHRIFNIGNSSPKPLRALVAALESALGVEAKTVLKPMQPGDVSATFADITRLNALTGYRPRIDLEEGIDRFVDWRKSTMWRPAWPQSVEHAVAS